MKLITDEKEIEQFFTNAAEREKTLLNQDFMKYRIELLKPGQWFVMEPGERGTQGDIWVVGQVDQEPVWDGMRFYGKVHSVLTMGQPMIETVWASQVTGIVSQRQAELLLEKLGDEWHLCVGVGVWASEKPTAMLVKSEDEETFFPLSNDERWWPR